MSIAKMNAGRNNGSAHLADAGMLLGVSAWASAMRAEILRVAPHPCSVLITGPTGTGKELIAQAIHRHGPRCGKPFIAVDCAAVNGTLFASHMFGHVKGAFTGAQNAALGCFRAADGGTIFLDEVGELEPEFQAKLLRVLQQRTIAPVGSHEQIPVDVRIIAATNRDLPEMVSGGGFRQDLFFRLNVIGLETVPLKDRPEDIAVLAEHLLAQLAARSGLPPKRLSGKCLSCLRMHDWPGNVRELENYLERASLQPADEICFRKVAPHSICTPIAALPPAERTSQQDHVDGAHAPVSLESSSQVDVLSDPWPTLSEMEREHIHRTLRRAQHNQTIAARLLGIPRQQLARKIKKHQLDSLKAGPGRPSKSE